MILRSVTCSFGAALPKDNDSTRIVMRDAKMRGSRISVFTFLMAISCWMPIAIASPVSGALHVQVERLFKEGVFLNQSQQVLISTQKNLLLQKQALEGERQQLTVQQTRLNQQAEAHNQQVTAQEKALHKNQSECNNMGAPTGANTSGHVNDCDNRIKALNGKTAGINAGISDLSTQQVAATEQRRTNGQKIAAWNSQEQETVNQLNLLYQNTNDWMDRSYDLIASSRFQNAARALHTDKYCSAATQPSGTITTQQLEVAIDYVLNCLRRTLATDTPKK